MIFNKKQSTKAVEIIFIADVLLELAYLFVKADRMTIQLKALISLQTSKKE